MRILVSDRLHFYIADLEVDRKQYEIRKVGERPFFSPISLHPGMPGPGESYPGQTGPDVAGPVLRHWGILLEASMVGAKVLGSDIAEDMAGGCVAT